MSRKLLLLLTSALTARGAGFSADSERGARLFQSLSCVECHSVNGTGGSTAPDLGRMLDRGFTPASLAATMWNHAPAMWASMRQRHIGAGALDRQAAQDLMAFFFAARFFEKPGDAARGKREFESRRCAGCHGLTAAVNPRAKPVSEWQSAANPLALLDVMWNHRAEMSAESGAQGAALPPLTEQALSDILVYLRNLPGRKAAAGVFRIGVTTDSGPVFEASGCAKCHQSLDALAQRVKGKTLTGIAVAMWNHPPSPIAPGAQAVLLSDGDMQALAGSFWASNFFQDAGRPAAGLRVFQTKNCAACHQDAASGAPPLPTAGRDFSSAAMVSVLWRHGPAMLDQMSAKNIAWPRFEGPQMADLIAYLNAPRLGRP